MLYYPEPESGLDRTAVNDIIEAAFAEHGRGRIQMPPKVYVTFPTGDFRTMPAYIPSLGIGGVKIVNVHPDNPAIGLPTVMALTVILDVETGKPEAILNATCLTDLRTGAAGAVAAKYLAPGKAVSLGVVGTGRQARAQVEAVSREISIENIMVWSRNEKNARDFCKSFSKFDCESASLEKVCGCQCIVTTTPSRKPLLKSEWIHDGTHINAIGADAPGKEELDPMILKRAAVFVDDPVQAVHSGEINVPIRNGVYTPAEIEGTLGEVVLGKKGRKNSTQITVFDSTGLAIQDLAIAKVAMKTATSLPLPFDV